MTYKLPIANCQLHRQAAGQSKIKPRNSGRVLEARSGIGESGCLRGPRNHMPDASRGPRAPANRRRHMCKLNF